MRVRIALLLLGITLAFGCETRVALGELPPCNAQLCPDGCCHEGECIPFTGQDVTRCGAAGQACQTCPGGDEATCDQGQCFRSLCGKCAGCCDGTFCMSGSSVLSCGRFGQACEMCTSDELCSLGACTKCGPHNCAGCCSPRGECLSGATDFDCGRNGEACRLCGGFTNCIGSVCQ